MGSFSVDAYLNRIRFGGKTEVSEDALWQITIHQAFEVPFETIDVHHGIPVRIDPQGLTDKLVLQKRGGFCFEVNQLLGHALAALGFQTRPVLARVRYRPSAEPTPQTHMAHLVTLGSQRWIADVGFGGPGTSAPLLLEYDREQTQFGDTFRIIRHEIPGGTAGETVNEPIVQRKMGARWRDLYSFSFNVVHPIDLEMASFFISHWSESPFKNNLICVLPTGLPNGSFGRTTLLNHDLSIAGHAKKITLTNDNLRQVLKEHFKIDAPEWLKVK